MTVLTLNMRMSETEREQFTALFLLAVEFGFKSAENGLNLEKTKLAALESLRFKER